WPLAVRAIDFVVDVDYTINVDGEIPQHLLADLALLFVLRMARVDHVQDEIGGHRFLPRRAEGGGQIVRRLGNEADRVDAHRLRRHIEGDALGLGVEGGEEFVHRLDVALRKAIEEGRLAGVGVAHQRDDEGLAAPLALRGAGALDPVQLSFQMRDAVADDAAVELERVPADPARAGAPRLPLEVRPRARQARQGVFELRQLNLRARLAAARAAGEDVENQAAAVDDRGAGDLLQVARLRRREVVVEDDERGAGGVDKGLELLGLPLAHERGGLGRRAAGRLAPRHAGRRGAQ